MLLHETLHHAPDIFPRKGQAGFSALVRAFIGRDPNYLVRFNPTSPHPQQATPRTWAALGLTLEKAPEPLRDKMAIALLGPETGQLFRAFQKHADGVPTLEQVLKNAEHLPVPSGKDLDKAWIFTTPLSDFLHPGLYPCQAADSAVGHAVGKVLCRLGHEGFEEVVIFSVWRAWRLIQEGGSLRRKSPGTQRFMKAVQALAAGPAFGSFAHLVNDSGAA